MLQTTSRGPVDVIGIQNQDLAIDLILSSRCWLTIGPMEVSTYDEAECRDITAGIAAEPDLPNRFETSQQPL